MTSEQIGGLVRAVLAALGGVLVALGYVGEQTVAEVAGAAAIIVTALWSFFNHRKIAEGKTE